MEDVLDARLQQIVNERNVTGLLLTDKQGLCIKTIGNAKDESSGVVSAISELVAKLEPNKSAPTVVLESDTKCCIIYSGKNMNTAIFKNLTH